MRLDQIAELLRSYADLYSAAGANKEAQALVKLSRALAIHGGRDARDLRALVVEHRGATIVS